MSFSFLFGRFPMTQSRKSALRKHRLPLYLELLETRTVPAMFNVNTIADTQAVNLTTGADINGNISLRSALEAANAIGGGNTVNLTVGGDYRIATPGANTGTNNSGAFVILPSSGGVTINNTSGAFADVDGAGLDRVFDINPQNTSIATTKITVAMSGFTIENGLAQPGDGAPGSGGGIRDQGNTNLTLTNMVVTGNAASADGGGISMENLVSTPWTLTINNSTITLNRAGDAGGGVESDGTGHVNITGSTITANSTVNQGAGVWLDNIAAMTVTNPVITNGGSGYTSAPTVTFTGGGATTAATGTATISNGMVTSIIITNPGANYTSAPTITFSGGGATTTAAATTTVVAASQSATLQITTSLIEANHAITGPDGGVGNAGSSTMTITSSTVADNFATMTGGGVGDQNNLGTLILVNDTIVDNSAIGNGGGVFEDGPSTLIQDCTVTGNASQNEGGGLDVNDAGAHTFTLDNTIVAGNFAGPMNFTGGMAPDIFATVTATTPASSGNFIGINDGNLTGLTNGANSNQIGTTGTPLLALLGPLQNNGGPTPTEIPLLGSPVVETGVVAVVPATDPITGAMLTDQRGSPRLINPPPRFLGNTVDIGSVEFIPAATPNGTASFSGQMINVNTTADTQAASPTTSPLDASNNISLRSALEFANDKGGGFTINLTGGGDYRITTPGANTGTNASGAFVILPSSGGVTINNTSGAFVDVDGGGLDRVFDINPQNTSIASTKITVAMSGFTIENGLAQPGDGALGSGGGIRDQGNTNLTLNNMVVTGNAASADGGAVSMENLVSTPWTLTLNNSTVSFNRAGDAGGGVETDGTGHVNITGSTITSNTTVNQGAGVWLDAIAAGTITNPVITSGGAGYTSAPTVTFVGGGFTTQATGIATISNGVVTSIIITNPGAGYTSAPIIMFTGGGATTTATATTTVVAANQSATLNITTSLINSNTAVAGPGGGVGQAGTSTVTITSSTLSDNLAGQNGGAGQMGGGFGDQNDLGTLILLNDTIVNNTAVGIGGGVAEDGPATLIRDTTVTGNASQTDGGGLEIGGAASFTLNNTIVAGNFSGPMNFTGGIAPDIIATVTATTPASSGNFIGINDGHLTGLSNGVSGNQIGTTTTPLIALLTPLQNNGGPTPTEAPLARSKVIDAGTNAVVPATDPITGAALTDQRGFPRIAGTAVDVGADESQPITIAPATLPTNGGIGFPYPNTTITATGAGGAPYIFAEAGTLPTGLTFNAATATLMGTPTQAGTFNIVITATNNNGGMGSATYTLTVLTHTRFPAFTSVEGTTFLTTVPSSFSVTFTGDATTTVTESGALPNGITFNAATDVLSGQALPGTNGNYSINFVATNSAGSATQAFTLTINSPVDSLGAFRASNGSWSLASNGALNYSDTTTLAFNSTTDQVFFSFSPPGSIGVAGDWTGSGVTEVGDFEIVNGVGTWHLDLNDNGVLDAGETFQFGQTGDQPVVGDWNGDGKTDIGVFRATPGGGGEFILDTSETHTMTASDLTFNFGLATDRIVVGDWSGAGKDEVGVFRDAGASGFTGDAGDAVFSLDTNGDHTFDAGDQVFLFGLITDGLIVGDWNGQGKTDLGVYRDGSAFGAPGTAVFSLDTVGNHQFSPADAVFLYGVTTDHFVSGHWAKTPPVQPVGTPQAQFAANGPGSGGVAPLTQAQLEPVVDQAIAAWVADGASATQLDSVQVQIGTLDDNLVGETVGNQITLDGTADGWGWNTDTSNADFTSTSVNGLQATPGSAAADKMDLLTVVEHELGHTLGLPDQTTQPNDLMYEWLATGQRKAPTTQHVDAVFANL